MNESKLAMRITSLRYLRADQAVAVPVWCLASSARAICDNDNNNHSTDNLASSATAIEV